MNKRKWITLAVVIGILMAGLLIYLLTYDFDGEEMNIQQDAKEILKSFEEQKKKEEKIFEWIEAHQVEDIGDTVHQSHSHEANPYNSPKGVVEYLFGTALIGDIDLFSSAYDFETLAIDISEEDTYEGKTKLLEEIVFRLTQNNTLQEVGYLGEESKNGLTEVEVVLTYKDEKKVKLSIETINMINPHDGEGVYYVKTSVWDLIKKIEEEK